MMFRCLNTSNKENIITIQGAKAADSLNPFASIVFQNYDVDTHTTYNMASISCFDHFGDNSNNGSGDIIFKSAYTDGSNMQEQMRIQYNGNVIVGANASRDHKLSVDGSIYATSFCNLLVDDPNSVATNKAPTSRLLNNVYQASIWTSNVAEWSSNASSWASNTFMFASNLLLSASWTSNTAFPWASNTATFASNVSASISNNDVPWLSNSIFNTSNTLMWASNTLTWTSNTTDWVSNTSLPSLSNVIHSYIDATGSFSNSVDFASNTSSWASNAITFSSNFAFTANWLSNTAFPSAIDISTWSSNTSSWLSNTINPQDISFASNVADWLSNGIHPLDIVFASNVADWLSNTSFPWTSNAIAFLSNFALTTNWLSNTAIPSAIDASLWSSNTTSWLSNISIPWLSNAFLFNSNIASWSSNTTSWTSNTAIPWLSNQNIYISNSIDWLSNMSIPWVSNACLISSQIGSWASNTSYWTSNTAIPWLSNENLYTSNSIEWLSNMAFPWVSNACLINSQVGSWASNTAYWTSNTAIPWTSNVAVFGSNTAYWTSNTAIPWASNASRYGSNTSFWTSNAVVFSSNLVVTTSNDVLFKSIGGNVVNNVNVSSSNGSTPLVVTNFTTQESNASPSNISLMIKSISQSNVSNGYGTSIAFFGSRASNYDANTPTSMISSFLSSGANTTNDTWGMRFMIRSNNTIENSVIIRPGYKIGINTEAPTYTLHVNGDIYASGDIIGLSDKRFKTNLEDIINPLDTLTKMKGYYYTRSDTNDSTKRYIGFMAQDLKEVVPEAVTYCEESDSYGVKYDSIIPILVECIKEMSQKIDQMNEQLRQYNPI